MAITKYHSIRTTEVKALTYITNPEKTENGYRICDFDDILIIEDSMAESGYRKYRFTNTIPETSDAAVIAVCALGLTAAVSVVLLLKKKG